jgi:hypothetical protein
MSWKEHEEECNKFLNETFGNTDIKFTLSGGSDSSKSDIKIVKNDELLSWIEAKMPNSQSGQFVVSSEDGKFHESKRNKSNNIFSDQIIDFMNNNYDSYSNCGTKGVRVDIPTELATD